MYDRERGGKKRGIECCESSFSQADSFFLYIYIHVQHQTQERKRRKREREKKTTQDKQEQTDTKAPTTKQKKTTTTITTTTTTTNSRAPGAKNVPFVKLLLSFCLAFAKLLLSLSYYEFVSLVTSRAPCGGRLWPYVAPTPKQSNLHTHGQCFPYTQIHSFHGLFCFFYTHKRLSSSFFRKAVSLLCYFFVLPLCTLCCFLLFLASFPQTYLPFSPFKTICYCS